MLANIVDMTENCYNQTITYFDLRLIFSKYCNKLIQTNKTEVQRSEFVTKLQAHHEKAYGLQSLDQVQGNAFLSTEEYLLQIIATFF